MAWIELHQGIFRHRKVFMLARELGINRMQAGAHLISLWLWALDNAPSGELAQLPADMIALGAEWEGDPQTFLPALITAGLVDAESMALHDWYEYAGRLLERRQRETERVRKWREEQRTNSVANGERTAYATRSVQGTPPDHTVPSSSSSSAAAEEYATRNVRVTGVNAAAGNGDAPNTAVDCYEKAAATIVTQLDCEAIASFVALWGEQTVIEAIREARGTGRWTGGTNYLKSILQRWEREGRDKQKPQPTPMAPPRPRNVDDDLNRRYRNLMPEGVK